MFIVAPEALLCFQTNGVEIFWPQEGVRGCGFVAQGSWYMTKSIRNTARPGDIPGGEGHLVVEGWRTRQVGVMGTFWQEGQHEQSLCP